MSTSNAFDVRIHIASDAVVGLIRTALSRSNTAARRWSRVVGPADTSAYTSVLDGDFVDVEDTINGGTYRLTIMEIERGLAIMAVKHPRLFGLFLAGNGDNGTASVFLQCALLGEVMYAS
jgi:hypothetical protein